MAERGVDTVVMEVSSHALALGRVDGTRFAVGAFTNLSRDHLDFHPTMADYFDAKARLFDPDSPLRARTVVVCVDDDAGRAMADRAANAITVSATGAAGALARRWTWRRRAPADKHSPRSTRPAATTGSAFGCQAATTSPIALSHWRFWTPSGCPRSRRRRGCCTPRVPGRLEDIDRGQDFLALVDYAHKPAALRAVLTTLLRPDRRLAVVFGAGGDRDPGKRPPMGEVAAELADLVVVTDDNPRSEDPGGDPPRDPGRSGRARPARRGGRDRRPARRDQARGRLGRPRRRGAGRRQGS